MRLSDKKYKRALIVNKLEKTQITLHKDTKILEAESSLSASSQNPYITSFNTLRVFLEKNDYVDAVITAGLNVKNIDKLVTVLTESNKLRILAYSTLVKSCNVSFFHPMYKGTLQPEQYIELLKDHLVGYDIHYNIRKRHMHVIIEKN